jgi:hypothetical protein
MKHIGFKHQRERKQNSDNRPYLTDKEANNGNIIYATSANIPILWM